MAGLGGSLDVFAGTVKELIRNSDSLTARYLRGDLTIPVPETRRRSDKFLTLRGVTTNNLKVAKTVIITANVAA